MKIDFIKTKALLEQKIDLQSMEIAELVDRLQREKDCYNAMFTALKSEAKPSQYSNLEAIKQIHEQQVGDMQNDYRSARRKLD